MVRSARRTDFLPVTGGASLVARRESGGGSFEEYAIAMSSGGDGRRRPRKEGNGARWGDQEGADRLGGPRW